MIAREDEGQKYRERREDRQQRGLRALPSCDGVGYRYRVDNNNCYQTVLALSQLFRSQQPLLYEQCIQSVSSNRAIFLLRPDHSSLHKVGTSLARRKDCNFKLVVLLDECRRNTKHGHSGSVLPTFSDPRIHSQLEPHESMIPLRSVTLCASFVLLPPPLKARCVPPAATQTQLPVHTKAG